jgi:DNA-binding MarR family transcriptional regulator
MVAGRNKNRMTESGRFFTDLVLETFRFNGCLIFIGDRMTEALGLSTARWQVLGAISHSRKPLTVADIARNMGLQRQSVQRTVDVLVDHSIVRTVENPNHQRARLVLLTDKGKAIFAEISAVQRGWANETSLGIPSKDLKNAVQTLRALRNRLETTK